MNEQKKRRLGALCCAAGAICWGVSGTCSEALFREYPIDSAWVTAVRMTGAGLLLMLWVVCGKKLRFKELFGDRKSVFQILAFALLGLAFCQYAYLSAIRWTNSGTATVLQNLSVVMIAMLVCVKTRTPPTKTTVLCVILAVAGVWLIATGGKPGNMQITPRGLFWGIGAAVGATSYTLLSREPVAKWGSIPVTGLAMLAGGCVLSPVVRVWNLPAGLDAKAVLLLVLIVLVGTVGAFTLFLQGISMAGPVKASILACMEPLTAAVLSAVWLHSTFSAATLVGFACVLLTVILMRE